MRGIHKDMPPPKVWQVELVRDGVRVASCSVVSHTEEWARALGAVAMGARTLALVALGQCGEVPGMAVNAAPLFQVAGVEAQCETGSFCWDWPEAILNRGTLEQSAAD